MAKHKAFLMFLACKKCLTKIIMHKNKGCDSSCKSFEKYKASHDTTKLDRQSVMEFAMEELLKLMHNLLFHQRLMEN
jgi:hypothetical protein